MTLLIQSLGSSPSNTERSSPIRRIHSKVSHHKLTRYCVILGKFHRHNRAIWGNFDRLSDFKTSRTSISWWRHAIRLLFEHVLVCHETYSLARAWWNRPSFHLYKKRKEFSMHISNYNLDDGPSVTNTRIVTRPWRKPINCYGLGISVLHPHCIGNVIYSVSMETRDM